MRQLREMGYQTVRDREIQIRNDQNVFLYFMAFASRHPLGGKFWREADLFHEAIPDDYIAEVANVMVAAHWHTYQVLTKRSDRMREMLTTRLLCAARQTHIWWGVSVENKRHGIPRIAELKAAPAAIRFLSIEPLLEDLGVLDLSGIDWVIVGGESGFGARPMKREWVISIRKQCRKYEIPFFFQTMGRST